MVMRRVIERSGDSGEPPVRCASLIGKIPFCFDWPAWRASGSALHALPWSGTLLNAVLRSARMVEKPIVGLRLSPDELALLEAIAAHEERSRSDVVRRAIRAYAEKLGVSVKPAKRPKK